jgi:hypothetical protein
VGQIEEIDTRLNGNGQVIVQEAQNAALELSLACALVEQESGGRNVFGCDHGDVGDTPPYCHQEVTRDRVQSLRDNGNYSHGMNGVGLTQLTWRDFVEQAEAEGGAHLPQAQCRVGFRLLKSLLSKYPYLEALGAYNAGEQNRSGADGSRYAGAVSQKHTAWKAILGEDGIPMDDTLNLQTVRGAQSALAALGFDPGAIDGKDGPKTQAAVVAFQTSVGLDADGKVGPLTRAALASALDATGIPHTG